MFRIETEHFRSYVFNDKLGLTIALRFAKKEDVLNDLFLELNAKRIRTIFLDPLGEYEIFSESELTRVCKCEISDEIVPKSVQNKDHKKKKH